MSIFASLGIIILSMLIMASLQLSPGVFMLFYHYASGKFSKAKTSDLAVFFILGTETVATCLFLSSYYVAYSLFFFEIHPENSIFTWTAVGILIALSLVSFFLYYRHGSGSQLFIARNFAKTLDYNASIIKTRSDAFTLGALSCIPELFFTLPLYIITAVEIIEMGANFPSYYLLTILYILVPAIPLIIIKYRFHSGTNLADLLRARFKDKPYHRFLLSFSFLTIAILIICFRIYQL